MIDTIECYHIPTGFWSSHFTLSLRYFWISSMEAICVSDNLGVSHWVFTGDPWMPGDIFKHLHCHMTKIPKGISLHRYSWISLESHGFWWFLIGFWWVFDGLWWVSDGFCTLGKPEPSGSRRRPVWSSLRRPKVSSARERRLAPWRCTIDYP